MCTVMTQPSPGAKEVAESIKEVFGSFGQLETQPGNDLYKAAPDLLRTRYKAAAWGPAWAVRQDNDAIPFEAHWQLIPWPLDDWSAKNKLPASYNARDDKIFDSNMWKKFVLGGKRCVVPMLGFFEPEKVAPKVNRYHSFARPDRSLMLCAGLWNRCQCGDQEVVSMTVVTTEPNATVSKFHNRMPALLNSEDARVWLDPENNDRDILSNLLKPYPDSEMESWRVTDELRSSKTHDTPEVIAPHAEPNFEIEKADPDDGEFLLNFD